MLTENDVREYIRRDIFPEYEKADEGHRLNHINYVLSRSFKFADEWNRSNPTKLLDKFKVEVIASYHDIGLSCADRSVHEKVSARMLRADEVLNQYFNEADINEMAEAVEDHRASLPGKPRSIYGMVVSQADRDTSLDHLIYRAYVYRKDREPYKNDFDVMKSDIKDHIKSKYCDGGYGLDKIWFEDGEFDVFKKDAEAVVKDDNLLTMRLLNIVKEKDPSVYRKYQMVFSAESKFSEYGGMELTGGIGFE